MIPPPAGRGVKNARVTDRSSIHVMAGDAYDGVLEVEIAIRLFRSKALQIGLSFLGRSP